MIHRQREMYDRYRSQGGTLNYSDYRSVIQDFNTTVMDKLIYDGQWFKMPFRLGELHIIRIKRDWSNPSVNWHESKKLKQEIIEEGGKPKSEEHPNGEDWLVYYDDPWYARFYWNKRKCIVAKKTAYSFQATQGKNGNTKKLHRYLENDDMAATNYRLVEHISKQQ